jgi:sugar phosphate isomerase/epimerase
VTGYVLGYGTNGFSNHRLDDALRLIADLGYRSVALTLDHHHLDPYGSDVAAETDRVATLLSTLDLRCVVETGARFLLDPGHKHHPTLVSADAAPRVDFLGRAIRIAEGLGADCVSFWSGISTVDDEPDDAWGRLVTNLEPVLEQARRHGVRLGMEPEPGMLVQHVAQVLRLRKELGEPAELGITLDIGHCVAVEPIGVADCVRLAGDLLVNVQLDDMLPGVHEHLEFGDGHVDLPAALAALDEIGYTGVAAVELPRHSHAAPDVARRAITALRTAQSRNRWMAGAERSIRATPSSVHTLFPAVGRNVGREPVRKSDVDGLVHGTVDDHARARLLAVLAEVLPSDDLAREVADLYRYGDRAERRGVLRGLTALPASNVHKGLEITEDALRTNDPHLVAAALGPFAEHLDQHQWRHGVLKCVFLDVPLAAVAGLDHRADAELRRMATDHAAERRAAGRAVSADVTTLLAEGSPE